jgi:hypothetical protein
MIPAVKAKLLEGKRGLVVGIANDQSIAWGCAKAFRAMAATTSSTRGFGLREGLEIASLRACRIVFRERVTPWR